MITNKVVMPLPADLWGEIIFNHTKLELLIIASVSKQFKSLANDYAKNHPPKGCFGKAEWLRYGGDPGVVPQLPLHMYNRFNPYYEMLTLIPETINGELTTLSSIDRFFSYCKKTNVSNYRNPLDKYEIYDFSIKAFKSHWVLLSKRISKINDAEYYYYYLDEHKQEVLPKGFEAPNLIDTIVSLFMENLNTGNCNYMTGLTYVEETNDGGDQIVVGNFGGAFGQCGLDVVTFTEHIRNTGLAYALKSYEKIESPPIEPTKKSKGSYIQKCLNLLKFKK